MFRVPQRRGPIKSKRNLLLGYIDLECRIWAVGSSLLGLICVLRTEVSQIDEHCRMSQQIALHEA